MSSNLNGGRIGGWWKQQTTRKRKIYSLLLLGTLVGPVLFFPFDRVNITTSESLRNRVYWMSYRFDGIKSGDFVMFEDSNYATGYKKKRLTKKVGCDAGDILEVKDFKEYYCNGKYIGRAKDLDRKGKKVEHFVFSGQIPPGKMFVIGQHKDSYDSRYMGLVEKNIVIGVGYPVF